MTTVRREGEMHQKSFDKYSDHFFLFAYKMVCQIGVPYSYLSSYIRKTHRHSNATRMLHRWTEKYEDLKALHDWYESHKTDKRLSRGLDK